MTHKIMKPFLLLALIFISTHSNSQNLKTKDCDYLLKKGYTKEFCLYNSAFQFKGILFGSKMRSVDSVINLERSNLSFLYHFNNAKYTDWAVTKFERGEVIFRNGKMTEISLILDGSNTVGSKINENKPKYNELMNYLINLFGKPEVLKDSSVDNNLECSYWNGSNLNLSVCWNTKYASLNLNIRAWKLALAKRNGLDNL